MKKKMTLLTLGAALIAVPVLAAPGGDRNMGDANKDGVVTKEELAKAFASRRGQAGQPVSERVFQALDADKDGKISAAEWQAAGERRFARLDRNNDGDVTADDRGRRGRRGDR